jgi:hypothetical protein
VVEVTAVAGDTFDARISSDAQPEVVTARFRRDWTALAFGVEREGRYADADLATFPLLGEALALARDLSGHWRVGETRPWERTVSVPPLVSVPMRGTLTLERLVSRRGRRAAAFAYRATGEGQYGLSRVRMSLSGRCWMDLATGFMLESQTSAPGQFTQSGEPVQMEIEEERVLDLPGSRGF